MELLSGSELGCQLHRALPLLVLHLVPPQSVLVEDSEAVDNYWYGQSQDKYARESTESSNYFSQQCLGIEFISHGGDCHQTPPERLHECPGVAGMVDN